MSCRSISITYRQPAAGGWPKCQLAPPPAWGPDEPGRSMSCWGSTAPKAQGMTLVWTTLLPWADSKDENPIYQIDHLFLRHKQAHAWPVALLSDALLKFTKTLIIFSNFVYYGPDLICIFFSGSGPEFCLTKVKVFEASLQVLVSLVSLLLMCQAQAIHMDEHFRGIIDFWR